MKSRSQYRDWSARLAPLALTLDRIRLSPRGGWQLHAVNSAQGAP